jgi:hypothetical protein
MRCGRLACELPIWGVDVVEVSPPYDHAEVTAFLANRVVLRSALRVSPGAVAPGRAEPSAAPKILFSNAPGTRVRSRC